MASTTVNSITLFNLSGAFTAGSSLSLINGLNCGLHLIENAGPMIAWTFHSPIDSLEEANTTVCRVGLHLEGNHSLGRLLA